MGPIAGHRPREAPCSFTHGRQGDYAAGAPQCTGPQASSRVANSRVSAAAVSYGEATPLHSVHGVCLVSCSSALGELRQCIDTLSCDGSPYLRMSNLSVWLTPGQACRACGRNRQQSRFVRQKSTQSRFPLLFTQVLMVCLCARCAREYADARGWVATPGPHEIQTTPVRHLCLRVRWRRLPCGPQL